MKLLTAKPVTERIRERVSRETLEFSQRQGRRPKLAVVLVGNDPASQIYTRKKGETAIAWGMDHVTLEFPAHSSPEEVHAAVESLNQDPGIDGILIQRPLPASFREEEVLFWVHPSKDVDAFHPENTGRLVLGLPCFRPCTPAGVIELLDHYQVPIAGKIACVIGRSSIVGKPMAALLLQRDATVLQGHSRTQDLKALTLQADLLVVAAGKPGLIDGSLIKPGATVVDVGIHRTAQQKVIGDVDFESASKKAAAITPVPGGVGPMTIAILLSNTLWAAQQRLAARA